MDFYARFVELCAIKGVSPSKAAVESGLTKPTVSGWKSRSSFPTDLSLQKLSIYFGISVDELLSGQKEKPATDDGDELSQENIKLLLSKMSVADLQNLMGDIAAEMAGRAKG